MIIHIPFHFIIPAIVAAIFFRKNWKTAFAIMSATILIDIDHILATPMFEPGRCSIGFHPLHGLLPILLYAALCFFPKTRYIGIGLVIHMALDSLDCQLTGGIWFV